MPHPLSVDIDWWWHGQCDCLCWWHAHAANSRCRHSNRRLTSRATDGPYWMRHRLSGSLGKSPAASENHHKTKKANRTRWSNNGEFFVNCCVSKYSNVREKCKYLKENETISTNDPLTENRYVRYRSIPIHGSRLVADNVSSSAAAFVSIAATKYRRNPPCMVIPPHPSKISGIPCDGKSRWSFVHDVCPETSIRIEERHHCYGPIHWLGCCSHLLKESWSFRFPWIAFSIVGLAIVNDDTTASCSWYANDPNLGIVQWLYIPHLIVPVRWTIRLLFPTYLTFVHESHRAPDAAAEYMK